MVNQSTILKNTSEYKESSISETLNIMQSSSDGLTEVEARQRLLKLGFNEVSEKNGTIFSLS